jgi:hypothetical protein
MNSHSAGLCEALLVINERTFQQGSYNVAYHALAGAFHAAREQNNTEQLALIHQRATDQLATIDRESPAYEHSTRTARARGHESVFSLLAHQASVQETMAHRQQARDDRLGNWPIDPDRGAE